MLVMGLSILLIYVLAVLAVLHSAHFSYGQELNEGQPPKCNKLLTRKEWRTLTRSEKAEWVGAIKVRPPSSPLVTRNRCLCRIVLGKHTTRTAILDGEPDSAGGEEEPVRRLLLFARISGAQRA